MAYDFDNVFELQDFCGRKYICAQQKFNYGHVYEHDKTKGLVVVGEWSSKDHKYQIIIY